MDLFLKCTQNLLQDRSHPGHKYHLSKFKKTEIIPSIFSDHKAMRLEINYKEDVENSHVESKPFLYDKSAEKKPWFLIRIKDC